MEDSQEQEAPAGPLMDLAASQGEQEALEVTAEVGPEAPAPRVKASPQEL
jgi:hypothetical protein